MKNIPERIYLNIGEEVSADVDFRDLSEVTWSQERMFDNDVAYTRKPQWISVEEKLPPGTLVVLCQRRMDEDNTIALCVYIKNRFMIYDGTFKYDKEFHPTHWMRIPKLPSLPDTNTEKKCGLATSNK